METGLTGELGSSSSPGGKGSPCRDKVGTGSGREEGGRGGRGPEAAGGGGSGGSGGREEGLCEGL